MTRLMWIALASVVLVLASACGGGDQVGEETEIGVVIGVEGDLTEIRGFTLRLAEGSDADFVPAPGLLFNGSVPLGHLREHLTAGEPVAVRYFVLEDGTLLATRVEDAS